MSCETFTTGGWKISEAMPEVVFAPEARNDRFPGLRLVGFERRVTVAFHVGPDTVTFLRILYCGRDVDTLLKP